MANPYVTPALFKFLRKLKVNNDRDWFNEHKNIYEKAVKEPLLDFIADFAPHLASISPHFLAIPKANGGSLFRIYRDIRFSKNKDPYKTHAAVQFRHSAGKNVHAPGFYLHLEPGSVFLAMGLWQPEMGVLTDVRRAIAEQPERWSEIISEKPFSTNFRMEGSSLKRAPKGFGPDHPLIDELKKKDFIAVHEMSETDALEDHFLLHVANTWGQGRRFVEFLTLAAGQPF